MAADRLVRVAGGEPARLSDIFHEAWIELAGRGRFAVLEAMGRRLFD